MEEVEDLFNTRKLEDLHGFNASCWDNKFSTIYLDTLCSFLMSPRMLFAHDIQRVSSCIPGPEVRKSTLFPNIFL